MEISTLGSGKTTAEAVGEFLSIKKMGTNMQDIGNKTRKMDLVNK